MSWKYLSTQFQWRYGKSVPPKNSHSCKPRARYTKRSNSAYFKWTFAGHTVFVPTTPLCFQCDSSHVLLLFSRPVVSDSSWPHGLQHARPPCPSPSPRVRPSSCAWYRWCHTAISSSDALFSFCPQSFPASGSFPMSQLFASGDQHIGASASASVLPMNIQGWFPLRWTCCPRGSQESSPAPLFEDNNSSVLCLLYGPALTTIHDYWKDHSREYIDLCWQSNVFAFQHTKFVTAFLPRSNCLLISWLQSPSTVILEPKKRKSVTASTVSPCICHEVMGLDAIILVFLIFSFKPAFFTLLPYPQEVL